jgi:hypothetical protein
VSSALPSTEAHWPACTRNWLTIQDTGRVAISPASSALTTLSHTCAT